MILEKKKQSKPRNRLFFFFNFICADCCIIYIPETVKDQALFSNCSLWDVTMELLPNIAIKHKKLDNEALMLSKVKP